MPRLNADQLWEQVETTAPASEPVSTAEAKTHLRVTHANDDTYIDTLVTAARIYCEHARGESFIDTTWTLHLARFPADEYIELPRHPLSSVSSVKYTDQDGNLQTMSSGDYVVDSYHRPGRVYLEDSATWPSSDLDPGLVAVQIEYVAGYGSSSTDVPQTILHAIKMLVSHWYEIREPIVSTGAVPKPVPFSVNALLGIDRRVTFP